MGNKILFPTYLAILCLLQAGCRNQGDDASYGVVDGWQQFTSRNGLGVHRKIWEQSGVRCVAPQRLSSRLNQVDVIVLVPRTFDPPGQKARQWLERWLREAPGRSVIYFGRDFNAEEYFFQQTLQQLNSDQRQLAQQRIAELQVNEMQAMLESHSESTFCDWFYLDLGQRSRRLVFDLEDLNQPQPLEKTSNDSQAVPLGDDGIELPIAQWPIRSRLLPPDIKWRDQPPSWISSPPSANPVQPISLPWDSGEDKLIVRSRWRPEELDSLDAWNAAFDQLLESEVLVSSDREEPLVFRLTSSQRLGEGQILVVANGVPFLNASILQAPFFQVSEFITQQCMPARRVALLAYDSRGLQISSVDEADERGAGLEMFLQWPLSAIMMPAALLGLIACVSLLPILGRPRELASETVSDFGLHVEALGQMLHGAGDEAYAKKLVAEYFRRVKGEPPPAWLEGELPSGSRSIAESE
jgi:hypothetical protein